MPYAINPMVVAFDKSGNMYVGQSNGSIEVFAPPFGATSVPTVTLNISTGGSAWNIQGMAITQ